MLQSGQRIQALFCEMPSNIRLTCPNIDRIRSLADKYDFIVACDETAGNFVNIDILPQVDILMSSLTKMFSGASNVTGGRPVALYPYQMVKLIFFQSCNQSHIPSPRQNPRCPVS